MAQYTVTLKEIIETSDTPLINPDLLIYDKEHLEKNLINHFLFREIAFPTPEQFKWKLNAYLSERAQTYNKMFASQLIEIDPFVTDYMVQTNTGKQKTNEIKSDKQSQYNKRDSTYTSDTISDSTENYTDSEEAKHYKENAGVELKAKLNSESENRNNQSHKVTDLSHKETTSENTNISTDTETTNEKTGNKDYTHNQTARNWTENGSSSGHKLNVHSDTPQAMLFNTPPHYTGTGRGELEGKTSTPTTELPKHYAESDPNSIDSANLSFNGGDSPWFNYASGADNETGHDSYAKNGTETFNQSDNTKETVSESGTKSETETKSVTGKRDFTETATEDNTAQDSRSVNANEHTKGDTKEQENYLENGSSKYDKASSNKGKRADNTLSYNDIATDRKQDNSHETNINNESIRKGRVMRSPSQLLAEYRQTLTFNADLWLYGELEPLFMQLF